jgi:hypothetical protein
MLNNLVGIYGVGVPVSTNSYESIATVTVGSGGQSSIDFTSIPSTYKHLQIRGIARSSAAVTASNCRLRFNSDTGSNYAYHYLGGDGAAAYAGATSSTDRGYAGLTSGASASANIFGVLIIDVLDYANTNKNKTVRALSGVDLNGSGYVELDSSLWMNTTAVSSLSLFFNSGNFAQYSSFALYGIKG